MHHKFSQSSAILRVFALFLTCFLAVAATMAQEKSPKVEPSAQPKPVPTDAGQAAKKTDRSADNSAPGKTNAELSLVTSALSTKSNDVTPTAATPPAKSNGGVVPVSNNASSDYKKTLNDLQALYEQEVQRLEKQNTQAKGLYGDGLISRVEMEKSDKDLADARAKVEEGRNQISLANKPAPVVPAVSSVFIAGDSVWSTGDNRVDNLVRFYGNKYGVDPYLIFCLMHQESRFTTSATSPKGAQGLMQLMPGTAARYGVTNPYDVAQSIMGGTRYLKDLLQMFNGRIDLALAGYNAGENAVIKHGYTVPPYQETRNYVRLIIARYGKKQTSTTTTPAL
jgi:soluble lytic murein transglycosylase-like protein